MPFEAAKVYYDGSHYIAIPYVPNPKKPKREIKEELIEILPPENTQKIDENKSENGVKATEEITETPIPVLNYSDITEENKGENKEKSPSDLKEVKPEGRKITRKQLFEELYEKTKNQKRNDRKNFIIKEMLPYFKSYESTLSYVNLQFDRKLRNLICRRVRLMRKVNLQEFNYFCTFTYDSEKHTEESFQKKLKGCFKMMCHRRAWKYVGVWERSPEKKRLHFHGLFYIPEGNMVGKLIEVKDYSPIKKKVQHTIQNTYFNERFGRSDFKTADNRSAIGEAVAYLIKYIEKTGEKIVYSKGLPQYFISDIIDDDILCRVGQEDKKLLLFDNFNCITEGCWVGEVSPDVIAQMPKSN